MRFRRTPPPDEPTAETIVQETPGERLVEETEIVQPPRRPRPPQLWPWLLLLALLVVGGIVAGVLLTRDHHKKKSPRVHAVLVTVPDVVGQDITTATAQLEAAGLFPKLRARASSQPSGTVVAQKPGGGARVAKGSSVTVFVSHLVTVSVPNEKGKKRNVAEADLLKRGLKPKVAMVRANEPAGVVVAQRPGAGSSVAKGSTVVLEVSKGSTDVPDVVGDSAPTAKDTLRRAGLAPNAVTVSSPKPKGIVVAQDPAAGKRVPKGSTVRINVSSGSAGTTPATTTNTTTATPGTTTGLPRTVRVPNVRGLDQTPAQRRIRAAGLAPVVTYISSTQPQGRVVSQSPAPGSSVRRGSKVRISVSSGPNPQPSKPVPDVVGQDEATATATLQSAGFSVQSVPLDTQDQSQNGVVIDEQPAGGSRAPQGSLVTIYVGVFAG